MFRAQKQYVEALISQTIHDIGVEKFGPGHINSRW